MRIVTTANPDLSRQLQAMTHSQSSAWWRWPSHPLALGDKSYTDSQPAGVQRHLLCAQTDEMLSEAEDMRPALKNLLAPLWVRLFSVLNQLESLLRGGFI